MRITSLSVEGVGKFGELTVVEGFGPGVNVLSAPNETGKSTLFRALHACLFERHSTKAESVRSLASEGRNLPVSVRVEFELEGVRYSLSKSFLRSPKANLLREGVEIAQGREADEAVWRLLGLEASTGKLDTGTFGILWVAQGDSARAPEPADEARNTLLAAIEAEIGALAGDEQARRILEQTSKELTSLMTTRGPKAGGRLAVAEAALLRASASLEEAERKLEALDSHIERLQSLSEQKEKLDDRAAQDELRDRLQQAIQRQQELDGAESKLREIEQSERSARQLAEACARDRDRLRETEASIDRDRNIRDEVLTRFQPLQNRRDEAKAQSEGLALELTEIESKLDALELRERRLKELAEACKAEEVTAKLRQNVNELTAWADRQERNQEALAANPATREAFRDLSETASRLHVAQARLEAAAAQVEIRLEPGGSGQVYVQGIPLAESATQAAVQPIEIRVGELATVRVTPAAGGEKAEAERAALATQLQARLEAMGVADVAHAKLLREGREALEEEAQQIRAALGSLGATQSPPAERIAEIAAEVERLEARVTATLTEAQTGKLPEPAEIEKDLEALAKQRASLRQRQTQLRGEVPKAAEELRRFEGFLNDCRVELNTIDARLESNLKILPDAERRPKLAQLEETANAAWREHQTRAAALEDQRRKTPSAAEIEEARATTQLLRRQTEAHAEKLRSLEREIHYLAGAIESAGGDGIGEKVEELREQQHQSEIEAQRWRDRVNTLELLCNTLDDCLRQRRESLHAPLHQRLAPFLDDVFPTAGLELGDRLSIQGLRRHESDVESFERLSDGTQEQIAVLVRLAMGALLASRGRPTPIILDDALMFSDDERIGRMFQALHRAGNNQQVIVLTCRERAFAALEGRRLSILSGGVPREQT